LISILPAILVTALGVAPQQAAPSATPGPATAAPAPAVPATSEPAGPGNVIWAISTDEAHDRALKDGKFVFFEFTKQECGNCERMDALL
jgi:hypothetical protein